MLQADAGFQEIVDALKIYFEGLYRSDTQMLAQVFHPQAIYACASEGKLLHMSMDEYFPVVDKRPAPGSRGEPRADRILSIDFAGPVTAIAKVNCAIGPRAFTDLLTFVKLDGRWQIMAKVFHFDLRPDPGLS
ncbi:putative lumazine-binding protein [Dongia mobilis]|uniref:Putative lumazine-binding protein n=1 Tax=Dongia mobilis TaxID=578943 RepID=A0A4R6WZ31_9PROT|nr:nuclear transport factor 2 family protein [Dongia mobilis]TDQ83067.1 putative lumazine-binding protein [Dongia mobilis]